MTVAGDRAVAEATADLHRRVLVLGGTAWLGGEIARQWVALGADVTCFARGASGEVPAGATLVVGDRDAPDAYAALTGEWDEVVDVSRIPDHVAAAVAALADRTAHWSFVSSASVYADPTTPHGGEDAELLPPSDSADPERYGGAKVRCEEHVLAALGDRAVIARAGLIVGPGDPTDRFGYWVSRYALADHDEILLPEVDDRFVQVIDVRDLARWIVDGRRVHREGVYDTIGAPVTLGSVLDLASLTADFTGASRVAPDEFFVDERVDWWAGERSLPLVLPRDGSYDGFPRRSAARFLTTLPVLRPLAETMADTLADERGRGLDRARRAGLDREAELELLAALR